MRGRIFDHFLHPTDNVSNDDLKRLKAVTKGKISSKILKDLVAFVEGLTVLSQDEKDAIVDGLADCL